MSDLTPSPEPVSKLDEFGPSWIRRLSLGGVCMVGFVLVGFLRGITETHPTVRATPHPSRRAAVASHSPHGETPGAKSYRELASSSLSPNANWSSDFSRLQFSKPGLFDPVTRNEAMKLAALTERAHTRAFDGAPPVIPHPVEQQSAANCLVCHGTGVKLGDKIATGMSHPSFASCTQCHVESQSSGPFIADAAVANTFQGRARSGPGDRAMRGSPPTIPHPIFLREDCSSCHGLIALPGIRTTHPWLSNCRQCHASSEELAPSPVVMTTREEELRSNRDHGNQVPP